MSRGRIPLAVAVGVLLVILGMSPVANGQFVPGEPEEITSAVPLRAPHYVIPLGTQTVTLCPTDEEIEFPCEEVWRSIPSPAAPAMTVEDLAAMAERHAVEFLDPTQVIILDDGAGPRAGLNTVFQLGTSVPSPAIPAFAAAEAYMESQFPSDAITVTISVSFASLGSAIIGGTSCSYGYASWTSSRSLLVGSMDSNDTIQSYLPSGSTIPVRYTSSSTPTNEDRVFWTYANWKVAGGTVSGNDASMQFSTNFPFDYDPSNGVGGSTISLQDVIIHETGHVLGFTSGIDFRTRDIEVMDVYRFQRTDGSYDYNPDTTAEFQVRPRLARWNAPNDDHNFDIISVEYRMSDGSPYQASHFREQSPSIGIMDPAFSYGQTFYPNFYRTSDLTVFDAVGFHR